MGRLIRWEPVPSLTRLRDEMARLMDDFLGEPPDERASTELMRVPQVDVLDREQDVVVRAEMPGIDKENIQLEATPSALMVRAEMQKETEEHEGNYVRRERRVGFYQRMIPLPADIVPDEVKARYHDGVLEVTLPKTEQARAKQPVQVKID